MAGHYYDGGMTKNQAVSCDQCGALVTQSLIPLHLRWHASLTRTTNQTRREVQLATDPRLRDMNF